MTVSGVITSLFSQLWSFELPGGVSFGSIILIGVSLPLLWRIFKYFFGGV